MLRMAVGLDRATRGPVSGLLSTAAAEVLDDDERRRYFDHLSRLQVAAPPHRPMWSTFESPVSGHGSFPKSPIHFLVVCSCDVTSANPMIEPDCVSASGQVQIRPCNHVEVVTLPRRYAGQCRCPGAALSAPDFEREQRSIDAQNGQAYHGRETTTTNGTRPAPLDSRSCERQGTRDASADASLRAFVRALARQAARECFELELKQQSGTIQ